MKSPKQADIESQKALVDVINNNKKIITLTNGKKVKIGYLTFDTQDKIDSLFVDYELKKKSIDKDDPLQLKKARKATRKFYAQTIAAAIINNYIYYCPVKLIFFGSAYGQKKRLVLLEESAARCNFVIAVR